MRVLKEFVSTKMHCALLFVFTSLLIEHAHTEFTFVTTSSNLSGKLKIYVITGLCKPQVLANVS